MRSRLLKSLEHHRRPLAFQRARLTAFHLLFSHSPITLASVSPLAACVLLLGPLDTFASLFHPKQYWYHTGLGTVQTFPTHSYFGVLSDDSSVIVAAYYLTFLVFLSYIFSWVVSGIFNIVSYSCSNSFIKFFQKYLFSFPWSFRIWHIPSGVGRKMLLSAMLSSPLKFPNYLSPTGPGEARLESCLLEIVETVLVNSNSRTRTSTLPCTAWLAVNQEQGNIRETQNVKDTSCCSLPDNKT